jgi:hypothetical protein
MIAKLERPSYLSGFIQVLSWIVVVGCYGANWNGSNWTENACSVYVSTVTAYQVFSERHDDWTYHNLSCHPLVVNVVCRLCVVGVLVYGVRRDIADLMICLIQMN